MNAPDCICSPGRLPLGAFCAGRDDLEREALHDDRISIRAPRAGRDFLRLQDIARALISIHAPRVGRDCIPLNPAEQPENFNPRAPCGARQFDEEIAATGIPFQSTRPVRGATRIDIFPNAYKQFQSTHPVRGATLRGSVSSPARSGFQSTHPVRGATMDKAAAAGNNEFQSTRPVWGATMCTSRRRSSATISIHAPRVGRDGAVNGRAEGASRISIHAPRVGRDHG